MFCLSQGIRVGASDVSPSISNDCWIVPPPNNLELKKTLTDSWPIQSEIHRIFFPKLITISEDYEA